MKKVVVKDLSFEILIPGEEIKARLAEIGREVSARFEGEELVLLGVLNGSFIVLADLAREIDLPLSVEFLRISSYTGTSTTGEVKSLLGLTGELEDKHVLIVEDIVDTGISMKYLLSELSKHKPKSLQIATLLFKKEAFRFNYALDYVGFEIPNKFVVGYGLDYDGFGRNLPDLYQLSKT
ncbi:hypoxanthine phosphoribosyltransferase [Algoriphagus sp. H41]|uniref:Hypoxanthine phosphoribosyltransferase n=1 Tax=Algoriphagus oliviformis TaxID=2811231 RepID=A0ABS3C821_9BACT|nr:hypoxanthine phosphoribosyltransferase [Algoriphagus oliviformis]MBN7813262.1 hypoxanthine phosphoribosyltransferase [Algoriphagus oliviformis]